MPVTRVSKALIPAAGRGTRFLPFTKAVPKELAPIVTTPALELVVAEAAQNSISDVLLVMNPDKQVPIDKYFTADADLEQALEKKGDDAALASVRRPQELAKISYTDQLNPRGLGHAIGCGEQFAGGEPLAVLLPDDLQPRRLLGRGVAGVDGTHGVAVHGRVVEAR